MEKGYLSNMDYRILELLKKDGRMSYTDIAKKVGLSRPAVKSRVESMQNRGIIKGFCAVVNPDYLPDNRMYVINMDASSGVFDELYNELSNDEDISMVINTTGSNHIVAFYNDSYPYDVRDYVKDIYNRYQEVYNITVHGVIKSSKGLIIPV